MIAGISKLYDKFKTTIPRKVRTILGLEDGDEIVYYKDIHGGIYIEKNVDEKKDRFKPL